MTITRIVDKFNPKKVWIIKRYSCGNYYVNQEISGKTFYKRFARLRKSYIDTIIE